MDSTDPTDKGPIYNFSVLRWCESDTHSVETALGILSLDLFPGWRCVQNNTLS